MLSSIDKKIAKLDEIDKKNSLLYDRLRHVKPVVPRIVVIKPS